MIIEEPVEIRHVSAVIIAICHVSAVSVAILPTGITIAHVRIPGVGIFQPHERVGALADLLLHTRVVLKIRIELRMVLQKLRIVDQRRCFAKLVGNFTMAIEKLIESSQVPACDVIAGNRLPILRDHLPVLLCGRSLDSRGRGLRARRIRDT